jgi:hypothetical protein
MPRCWSALDKAIVAGENVLRELMERESRLTGFRRRDTQALPADEAIYRSLGRRLLVVEANSRARG